MPKTKLGNTATVTEKPARWPRLLDEHAAAEYLSVSRWTIRDYIARGRLRVVTMPPLAASDATSLRRVLIDIRDLDAFVERHRQ
jgi:hypothetical protein